MISNEVYTFISNFDKASPEERASLISPNPMQVIFKNNIYGYRLWTKVLNFCVKVVYSD